ncbi:hypothetical protein MBAV_001892 [Candidatus Magnetobacterium bavaricum]|uniref:Uncharacterized protein n=1 Tax=Candidatus Magnetobacterium bavaricum TaxID=29290 RepID=A0A0F3GVB6_9BACT|nr:hypothetical protein MBAV_001892 [Candidatus Magnetobacterium bavaricum]
MHTIIVVMPIGTKRTIIIRSNIAWIYLNRLGVVSNCLSIVTFLVICKPTTNPCCSIMWIHLNFVISS